MGLFWTGSELAAIRREQSKAWLEDLAEFDADTVANACREWRRTHNRKPAIADIRRLCLDAQPRGQSGAPTSTGFAKRPVTMAEAELRRRREGQFSDAETARELWARACGYASFADAWTSPLGLVEIGKRHPAYVERQRIADMTRAIDSTEIAARASSDATEDVL